MRNVQVIAVVSALLVLGCKPQSELPVSSESGRENDVSTPVVTDGDAEAVAEQAPLPAQSPVLPRWLARPVAEAETVESTLQEIDSLDKADLARKFSGKWAQVTAEVIDITTRRNEIGPGRIVPQLVLATRKDPSRPLETLNLASPWLFVYPSDPAPWKQIGVGAKIRAKGVLGNPWSPLLAHAEIVAVETKGIPVPIVDAGDLASELRKGKANAFDEHGLSPGIGPTFGRVMVITGTVIVNEPLNAADEMGEWLMLLEGRDEVHVRVGIHNPRRGLSDFEGVKVGDRITVIGDTHLQERAGRQEFAVIAAGRVPAPDSSEESRR